MVYVEKKQAGTLCPCDRNMIKVKIWEWLPVNLSQSRRKMKTCRE